ncbi:S-methyl-5-thioribose-1-phosphate isomerase [Fodinicola acaciae]|uniref:S-methyl-5-thioribose-1-phosphate isomerase n=1 Tax=Fodinicola acaciae TaxID=2681555 RepID=UPI001FEA4D21|nr:S-methyl-5-thioribose-1-phosphate isomerase [Fodinicola acaciae]
MRSVDLRDTPDGPVVEMIDQTQLPDRLVTLTCRTAAEVTAAIARLSVRGAPAIGVAGAMGVALAAWHGRAVEAEVDQLRNARPTAVNLARGVDRAAAALTDGYPAVRDAALALRDEEEAASAAMATLGANLVGELLGDRSALVLTHCNTGALATTGDGTALAVVRELHRRRRLAGVIASETRPLLQGARLTGWELASFGAPYRIAVDGAGPFLLARGEANVVLLGADRVCANGDVVNKVGTYAHALGARRAGVPFVVVAPESTVDRATATGAEVSIEDRDPAEVLLFAGRTVAPAGAAAVNPAFDVTPAELVTALVTDRRVVRYDRGDVL